VAVMWARPCPVTIPSRPHELDRGQLRSRPALGRAALTPGPSRRPAGPLAWVGAVALPGRSVPRSRACPGHPLVPCPPFRCPSLALVPSLPEPACSRLRTRTPNRERGEPAVVSTPLQRWPFHRLRYPPALAAGFVSNCQAVRTPTESFEAVTWRPGTLRSGDLSGRALP